MSLALDKVFEQPIVDDLVGFAAVAADDALPRLRLPAHSHCCRCCGRCCVFGGSGGRRSHPFIVMFLQQGLVLLALLNVFGEVLLQVVIVGLEVAILFAFLVESNTK